MILGPRFDCAVGECPINLIGLSCPLGSRCQSSHCNYDDSTVQKVRAIIGSSGVKAAEEYVEWLKKVLKDPTVCKSFLMNANTTPFLPLTDKKLSLQILKERKFFVTSVIAKNATGDSAEEDRSKEKSFVAFWKAVNSKLFS